MKKYTKNQLFLSSFLVCFFIFFSHAYAKDGVLFAHVPDSHSSLDVLADQLSVIDIMGQDYLQKNPNGEFVIYIGGDFTSIDVLTDFDKGKKSLESLKLLIDQGYTLVMTLGNHDCHDWATENRELCLEQIEYLKSIGVHVLMANLETDDIRLQQMVEHFYELSTLYGNSVFMAHTLESLLEESSHSEQSIKGTFDNLLFYKDAIKQFVSTSKGKKWKRVFLGIHDSNIALDKLAKSLKGLKAQFPLMMGGHDHLFASYFSKGTDTLISGGGSHGDMNFIEVSPQGEVTSLVHVPINAKSLEDINPKLTPFGEVIPNSDIQKERKIWKRISKFKKELNQFVDAIKKKYSKVLATTKGFNVIRRNMRAGPNDLGSLVSESLLLFARSLPGVSPIEPIIAFSNSNNYRLEVPIKAGNLTEYTVRQIYPFLSEAAVFKLKGSQVKRLYFSLKKHFAPRGIHTPQLNFGARENNGKFEILMNNNWVRIETNQIYTVAVDGWLSDHRQGESYKIPEWIEILKDKPTVGEMVYRDLLIKHFPQAITAYEENDRESVSSYPAYTAFLCEQLL